MNQEEYKERRKEVYKLRKELVKEINKHEKIADDPNNSDSVRQTARNTAKAKEKQLAKTYPSLRKNKLS